MPDDFWLWATAVLLLVIISDRVVTARLTKRFGVRPNLAMLERAKRFMVGIEHADQLVRQAEIGQAMLVLDELVQRPEIEEMPALAAQVQTQRARLAMGLNRHEVALPSARRSVEFYRQVHTRLGNRSSTSGLGEGLLHLAQIHVRRGEYQAALEVFDELRELSKRGAFRQTVVRTELELAGLYLDIDEHAKAATHAEEGHRLAAKWRMRDHAVEALALQGIAVGAAGDLDGARALLDTAEAAVRPDAPARVRGHCLVAKFGLAQENGDLPEQLSSGLAFIQTLVELKVGWGWRGHQADLLQQLEHVEAGTLEAGARLTLGGDQHAAAKYATALSLLRQSEIASLLRSGVLDADSDVRNGLPGVIASVLRQLETSEDPTSPAAASSSALYEKLEAAASARFRQLVQGPGRRDRVVPPCHFVQLRMIENDGCPVVYGTWEAPGRPPAAYRSELPGDLASQLRDVSGLADRARPSEELRAPAEIRASTKGWPESRQYAALRAVDGSWRSLAPILLPLGLLDMLLPISPSAKNDEVPLIILSPDSVLWQLPYSALKVGESGTTLGDHAAVALLPSNSLLRHPDSSAPQAGEGALSYLHGVNEEGLHRERAALRAGWGDQLNEIIEPSALIRSLGSADRYALLAMSVHGDSRPGLAHSLVLDPARSARISAARMMGMRFPRTVVVGACFSAALDKRSGTDPVGLPSVMLCRGASTVIGGTFPLADGPRTGHATATILDHLYRELAGGARAPWALRRAQQRWQAEHDPEPLMWAGLTAMTNGDLR